MLIGLGNADSDVGRGGAHLNFLKKKKGVGDLMGEDPIAIDMGGV